MYRGVTRFLFLSPNEIFNFDIIMLWGFILFLLTDSNRHHQHGRWQARIGRVAGNKDLYLGTFSKFLHYCS